MGFQRARRLTFWSYVNCDGIRWNPRISGEGFEKFLGLFGVLVQASDSTARMNGVGLAFSGLASRTSLAKVAFRFASGSVLFTAPRAQKRLRSAQLTWLKSEPELLPGAANAIIET
jgi:hypothetical protein